jgi:lysozyme family protein
MTKDDIIRMAREAGFERLGTYASFGEDWVAFTESLEAFASLVAAHKAEVITAEAYRCGYKDGMEAAAVICENVDKSTHPADLAAAIRARGNT